MLLYHFTSREHMESILREGLSRGDVPLRERAPLFETNAVWFTDIPQAEGCGLGDPHVLTEGERFQHFYTFGEMPPPNSCYGDKKAVRITVAIPSSDRRLKRWTTYGRKHCEPGLYDNLVRANGQTHKHWWLYFGTIAPERFRSVEYLR
jgi:hypothetical protein